MLRMCAKPAKKKSSALAPRSPRTAAAKDKDKSEARQPKASRPVVHPSYGFPTTRKGLLDWSWARQRLTESHNYVIITVRPDSRPHAMGMHGIWMEDAFYFGTGVDTRKTKNLASNPHCVLVNERLDELIIVEGTAEQVEIAQFPKGGSEASKNKYGWPMKPGRGGVVFRVTPRVVFAFPEKKITTAVTRWIFE
jgi:hypothetical protein